MNKYFRKLYILMKIFIFLTNIRVYNLTKYLVELIFFGKQMILNKSKIICDYKKNVDHFVI